MIVAEMGYNLVRRKVKCDKTIPCTPCVKRKAAHNCRIDGQAAPAVTAAAAAIDNVPPEVKVIPVLTKSEAGEAFRTTVYAELDVLRRRIFQLEALNARVNLLEAQLQDPPEDINDSKRQSSTPVLGNGDDPSDVEQDAAVTLEFFALGADRRADKNESGDSMDGFSRPGTPVSARYPSQYFADLRARP